MKKRHVLVGLAIIATLSLALPALAAGPSPLKLAKRALKLGKSADKRARKAEKSAKKAVAAANKPGPRGATGPAGLQGAVGPAGGQGAQGVAGTAGTNGSNGATGATGATGTTGATGATGVTGSSGTNHAYGAASPSSFLLSTSGESTVATLTGVSSGKFLVQGKVRLTNTANAVRTATCTLYDGSTALDSDPITIDVSPGDTYRVAPFLATRDKTGAQDFTIKCQQTNGSSGEVIAEFTDIAAIEVDAIN
jgi:hypothetical protein